MILLTLVWSLLTASQASDMTLILQQEKPMALYPKLFSTEAVIPCDCGNMQCDSVYWFRTLPASGQVQFLGKLNNANVASHVPSVKPAHFDLKRKTKTLFLLKIRNVTEEDTGVYSCVLKDRKTTEVWKSGILLLPGVIPPTSPPTTTTKKPVRTVCNCSRGERCSSLVLWPLAGTMPALALALICTLCYFRRLPKKCRHRFEKKRLMT